MKKEERDFRVNRNKLRPTEDKEEVRETVGITEIVNGEETK